MDKTEFIQLEEFDSEEENETPDSIIEAAQNKSNQAKEKDIPDDLASDLLDELGI